jgi:hypothetical protein
MMAGHRQNPRPPSGLLAELVIANERIDNGGPEIIEGEVVPAVGVVSRPTRWQPKKPAPNGFRAYAEPVGATKES